MSGNIFLRNSGLAGVIQSIGVSAVTHAARGSRTKELCYCQHAHIITGASPMRVTCTTEEALRGVRPGEKAAAVAQKKVRARVIV